ncbi:uncharacterized protein PG998_011520 [Apiospora kogelbergensis]|uniref:uncharacterized protein n=1 Tax=Apiospora kogelbergensis TaxID=1337665 RepID=UPI00312D8220
MQATRHGPGCRGEDILAARVTPQRPSLTNVANAFPLSSQQISRQVSARKALLHENMDGLSAGASVIAVVGLAGQILTGIKTITDFWGAMQDAPQDIGDTVRELQLLGAVLERMTQTASNLRQVDPLLRTALDSCKYKVDRFVEFSLQVGCTPNSSLPSSRSARGGDRRSSVVKTWKTFKAAFQAEKLNKFRLSLGETKLTLALVRQDLAERLQYKFQEQVLHVLANGLSNLSTDSQTVTVTTTVGNSANADRHTAEIHDEVHQVTRTMSNPIFQAGYEAGLEEALSKLTSYIKNQDHNQALSLSPASALHPTVEVGWKNTLRTFRAVPDSVAIFEFCRSGNLPAVRTMLTSGQASALDTNSIGWTPLHFASYACDDEISRLLIDAGADVNALTYDFPLGNYEICSPLVAASTFTKGDAVNPKCRIDLLRLLMKDTDLDFSYDSSQAWKLILVILERSRPSSGFGSNWEVAIWLFDLFQEDISEFCPLETLYWMLLFCVEDANLCSRILDMRPEAVNLTLSPGGFTVIHAKIAENFPTIVLGSFQILTRRGANLHCVGTTSGYGADTLGRPIRDTPTSMAMRRSVFFDRWREFLRDSSLDLVAFTEKEIQSGPLRDRGWTAETLLKLFNAVFEPRQMPDTLCHICSREVYLLYACDETWWEDLKSSIVGNRIDGHSSDGREEERDSDEDVFYSYTPSLRSTRTGSPDSFDSASQLYCWKCDMMREVRDESRTTGSAKYSSRIP